MKTKLLLFGMVLSLMTISCSKDDSTSTNDGGSAVVANQKVDSAMDDVAVIADDQYEADQANASGRGVQDYTTVLPECAHVTIDASSTATHRIINILFGGTGAGDFCVFRGHHLRGQITLTRDASPTSSTKTMSITYTNFYVDDNKLEGTTTWTRVMIDSGTANERPRTTLTMTNMRLTTADGVYTRNGIRVREMSRGFSTRTDHSDDEFISAGQFSTTHPNGDVYSSVIETSAPLLNKISCGDELARFPVSGILVLSKHSGEVSHTTTINYGSGDCDNLAMMSIDGGVAIQITLH